MNATEAKALREVCDAQFWFEREQAARREAFRQAREAGCSWVEIGNAAGMTEAGARRLAKTAGKVAA